MIVVYLKVTIISIKEAAACSGVGIDVIILTTYPTLVNKKVSCTQVMFTPQLTSYKLIIMLSKQ